MAQLRIPEEYAGGLGLIATLPDDAVGELAIALTGETLPSLDAKNANRSTGLISAKVPSIPIKDLRQIVATILSLYSVLVTSDVSVDDFVNDIIEAMRRSKRPDFSLQDPESPPRVQKRLKSLLGSNALTIAAKAVAIQHEHEHTLCTLRIFTDARPVYGDDVSTPPSAVAVTHMLKLTYHEGRDTKEIHIALDKDDLTNLKAQIVRAESKVSGLRKVFQESTVLVIE